jgi:hypothetical protein
MVYIFHSVQTLLVIVLAIATKGKSTQKIDDGVFTRYNLSTTSDVTSQNHVLHSFPFNDSLFFDVKLFVKNIIFPVVRTLYMHASSTY